MAGDLAVAVDEILGDADEVEQVEKDGAVEYRRLRALFAVVRLGAVEIRLRPDIADAVLRTPDTAASPRGDAWIRFSPTAMDQGVQDRLEAWLTAAWRSAGSSVP